MMRKIRVKPQKSKKGWIIAAVIFMILLAIPKGNRKADKETASNQASVQEKAEETPAAEQQEEIDADFRESVDYCEGFINAYAELIGKISAGDTSEETMETYTKSQETYTKVSEWLSSVNTDKLNSAEAEYYESAMARIAGEMLQITSFKPAETKEPEKETADESYIRPEFKEAMDSYEAFFDEYIALTEKISKGDSSTETMLAYTQYLAKYADVMQKLDEINEDELTAAELLYYEEVMLRITQKLSAVSN